MLTIEQAARIHSSNLTVTYETLKNVTKEDFEKSFIAGVEFAQRWISVEEELPEPMKQVIVKLENGWCTCTWLMNDGEFAFNVHPTYWRPIDLK